MLTFFSVGQMNTSESVTSSVVVEETTTAVNNHTALSGKEENLVSPEYFR